MVMPSRGLCKVSSVLLAIWCAASVARAATPERYEIEARVDRATATVSGAMRVTVRLAPEDTHVRLWLYPERMRETPSAMDERSWRWIFPGEVDRGGITVSALTVDGAPVTAEMIAEAPGGPRGQDAAGTDLRVPVAGERVAGERVTIALRFTLRVPGRFGRLGHDDGLLSAAAPWYPLVIGDDDAFDFGARHRVRVDAGADELLLDARRFEGEGEVERDAAYVPLSVAARFHERRVEVQGVTLVVRSTERLAERPPPERRGEAGLIDLADVDLVGRVAEVAEDVLRTARAFGLAVPDEIVLTPIPSRTELAATAPSVVLYSDHLFQIFPIEQTLQFHRRALQRALFAHLAAPLAAVDPPADRGWATDLRAVVLVDLDAARRRSGAQTPQELLNLFAFHPAVDQLLYAPQIAFEDAYFAAIEERDPFRDDPVRARRPLSRGRRILEMGRDALEERPFQRWVAMLVNARRPARDARARAAPALAERLPSWLAATGAPVNYRLGERTSERLPGGRWRHTIVVHREGADRVEPVEVRVEDDQGNTETLAGEAAGPRGELTWETEGALAGVLVDPRYRLPQSPEIADGHPRVDDATELPWRPPILNGFLFNLLVSEGDFTGLIDFALRRRYDLEHSVGFRLERTRATTGGLLSYTQGVGPKVHTNRRMGALRAGLDFDRLHSFFGDGELGGWRGQITLSGGLNTVRFALDPREGFWASAALTGGLAFRDDGTLGFTLRGGARGGMVLPLGLVNAFVVVGGGGFTAGEALPSELQTIGGASRLRGYESGEMLGRGALYLVAEHRWSAFRDLSMNLGHVIWVREIQLAFFGGVAAAFETTDGRDVAGAADVGAGVRVHYEYGGVQPGVISLDVGVPLIRDDSCVRNEGGDCLRVRNPIGFYIGFDQYF